jgi:tRNA 5-methylaminomethyl-2-thiouridine biosynthesis bifunctional protein
VAARSAPGCMAATFTVAGFVRRGLEEAGFTVAKQPGHGRKKQRLEAVLPGLAADPKTPSVAIIGAGVAGAALARAFRALGVDPVVFACQAEAASGNPAALVTPALDAGGGGRAVLYAQAYARATALYDAVPEAVIARGADLDAVAAKDPARFAAVVAQDVFDPGALTLTASGMRFEQAPVVRPSDVLAVWSGPVVEAEAVAVTPDGEGWIIALTDGRRERFDAVIIAAGWGSQRLALNLVLQPVRGQASWALGAEPVAAASFGGYVLPMDGGVLFGATHDRDVAETEVRPEDHARNLELLTKGRPSLAVALTGKVLLGRVGIRAATPDRLPLAGQIALGLFTLTGLGSRGFTTAPLLAEHVAALVLGQPSPLPVSLAHLVRPIRNGAGR